MINANPIMVVYAENEQDALLCLAKLIVYFIMCISGHKCYLGDLISKKFDTVDLIHPDMNTCRKESWTYSKKYYSFLCALFR